MVMMRHKRILRDRVTEVAQNMQRLVQVGRVVRGREEAREACLKSHLLHMKTDAGRETASAIDFGVASHRRSPRIFTQPHRGAPHADPRATFLSRGGTAAMQPWLDSTSGIDRSDGNRG